MVMKHAARKTLCKLATPVLDKKTPRFLDQVEHWLEHKGTEWLSERWKGIRNAALLVRSGNPEAAVKVMSDAGISVRKDQPVSRGPFGIIQLAYIAAQDSHRLRTCEALLRGYTAVTLKTCSKKQVGKARKVITGPSTALHSHDKVCTILIEKVCSRSFKKPNQDNSPDITGICGIKSYYTGYIGLGTDLRSRPFASAIVSSLVVGSVPKSVVGLCGDNPIRTLAEDVQKEIGNNPDTFGKVSFLQEGGCKARVICLPSFWMQAYYKPLQDGLLRRLAYEEANQAGVRDGISCVYDQNRGAYALQQWMRDKRPLWSFDLSAATDRFPLQHQITYLRKSGLEDWAIPVQEAARGQYYVPSRKENWSYSVGQPMGLNFSFPLFHLTHHAILEGLSKQIGPTVKPSYAVLGDDVLIADKALAFTYRKVIEQMGVEISSAKSLEGVDVQTFAGFTGVSTSRGIQIFRPFKHGMDFGIKGRELNLLDALGPQVRKWSAWWSRSFDQFNRTYPLRNPDLSPILPGQDDRLMGLGPGSRWYSSTTELVLRTWLKWRQPGDEESGDLHLAGVFGSKDWNRLWSTLLREKESVLTSTFDVKQYVTDERAKLRTNQLSKDPLIRDQKMLDSLKACAEHNPKREVARKSCGLGR